MRTLSMLLLLSSAAAISQAAPIEALKPMAFLAGHCWKGDFPGARQSDEHCFQWMYDGQALTYRVHWTPVGSDAYEAFSEINMKDKWVTQFKLVLKRQ